MSRRTKLQSSLVNSKQGSSLVEQAKVHSNQGSIIKLSNQQQVAAAAAGPKHISKVSPDTIEASKNFINNRPTTSGDSKTIEGFKRAGNIGPILASDNNAA